MNKSLFHVSKMDCPAEESLVKMKLDGVRAVKALEFDLPRRTVAIYHVGELPSIESALASLGLGSKLVMTQQTAETATVHSDQRRVLWTVLAINAGFFILEMVAGFVSGSMGLIADSLDMLADALVYGLSLLAVEATTDKKKNVAKWSGYFQMALAVLGFVEVLRRFIGMEVVPDFRTMIAVSVLALFANVACLYLLWRSRDQDAHMRASLIFTSNDVIINLGVISAGGLVLWSGSALPDLVVGAIVFVIVSVGAVRILRLAR